MKEKISWMFYMNRKKRNFEKYFKHYNIKNYLDLKEHIDTDKFIVPVEEKVKEYFVKDDLKLNNTIKKPVENKVQIQEKKDVVEEALSVNPPKKRKIRKKRQVSKDEDKQT